MHHTKRNNTSHNPFPAKINSRRFLFHSRIKKAGFKKAKQIISMGVNKQIAEIFYQMGEILEIKGEVWESRAYQKAARIIEGFSKDLEDVYKQGGLDALMEIPGVGEGLAKKIEEFIKTGEIKKHQDLIASIPNGLLDIISVQGLGPKKARKL